MNPNAGGNEARRADFDHLLYGGDYNPEQWQHIPGIWDEDMRLMDLARVNTVSLGIFSWAALEPEEGRFEFGWMDDILDRLAANGVRANLATPSGAKPAWLALKYPEVRRVAPNGLRDPQQGRHNHCLTSPVYREKVREINGRLAERYRDHPALQMWHVSNEYGGHCHCDLCMAAFRQWLRRKYDGDLDAMNNAWWSRFWSHTVHDWDQITHIDGSVHGMRLDWYRFMTDQCIDFLRNEIAPLRQWTPEVPVTTNLMGTYDAYDYWRLAEALDVVSWDSYPSWHAAGSDVDVAVSTAFTHDIYRAMKGGKPWILMETTPSATNWQPVSRPRRPGVNRLNGLQAIAHGSDSVLYFQWRKSRGSSEKFHGAMVDHVGHEHTRVFREAAVLGAELEKLQPVAGARTDAEVALVYDWQNRWAIDFAQGPRNQNKEYVETCVRHYRPFWERGIAVDVVESTVDLSRYRLVVAPMLYMLRPGVAERIAEWVRGGGTFVATYLTGITDENDLCFLGGFPGPLRPVLGVWAEETDVLQEDGDQNLIPAEGATAYGLSGGYRARHYCDILHTEGAETLATYGHDFYAGSPALTVNRFGEGQAFYIASRNDSRFTDDFFGSLADRLDLRRALPGVKVPNGVTAQRREGAAGAFVFVQNYNDEPVTMSLGTDAYADAIKGSPVSGQLTLPAYGAVVLKEGQ